MPALPVPARGIGADLALPASSQMPCALAQNGRIRNLCLAVRTANVSDAQRAAGGGLPWFAGDLRCPPCCPTGEALHLRSLFHASRPGFPSGWLTLWAALQGEIDILLVPASTADLSSHRRPSWLPAALRSAKVTGLMPMEMPGSGELPRSYSHVAHRWCRPVNIPSVVV